VAPGGGRGIARRREIISSQPPPELLGFVEACPHGHGEGLQEPRRSSIDALRHELLTPLTTIKVAASTLLASGSRVTRNDVSELAALIEEQADRLYAALARTLTR